jgi:RsiW-degrading membrane proteinase PrsW (M82 family)
MIKVGYFVVDKNEINLFLDQKKEHLDLKVNETFLLKKHKGKGLWNILPKLFLIGGILAFLIAGFLYLTNSHSVGFASYSQEGNSILSSDNSINWFDSFLIGIGLIITSLTMKFYNNFEKR